MKLLRFIYSLQLLAPLFVCAQAPPQIPAAALAQLQVAQPLVDVSSPATATAEFDPPVVRAGEKTFYHVSVGATQNSIEWPAEISAPAELNFGAAARGEVTRLDGSRFRPLTAFAYEVTTSVTGHFTVSNFVVTAGEQRVEIPAASLDVVETNAGPPARRLLLEVSETNLFFGQPFRVRALLPAAAGNQIEALRDVQFNGSGFMTDKFATRASIENISHGGQSRPAYVHEVVMTPLTAGPMNISAQAFTAGRDFGGPIVISGQVTIPGGPPKYILLFSAPLQLNVRPLPTDGELPGFTGAMGKFITDKPLLSTNRVRVGEPLRLKFNFNAGTNLVRLVPPSAPRSREWQIIAGKPGQNLFTLIPLTDEATNTPAIPFCAFDPVVKTYYDLTIPALPVTVMNDGLPVQLAAWNADEKNLAPLKLSALAEAPGKSMASLKPLQKQGWFVVLQIVPVLGFIVLWRWDERRRFLEAHPEIVRRRKALRDLCIEKKKLQAAIAAGDLEKFVMHAATAMRIAVAPHFPAAARAMVGGDVLSLLDERQQGGREGVAVRKIFAAADAQFSRSPQSTADLMSLRADVAATLQTLEEKL